MKRLILLPVLAFMAVAACRPKTVDCMSVAVKSPCYVAFKGIADTDLHVVVRTTYRQGTNFTELIAKDTFRYPNIFFNSDTAFSSPQLGLLGVMDAGNDYEIGLPDAARTFRITELTYPRDTVSHWTAEGSCENVHSYSVSPVSVRVDNQFTNTAPLAYANSTRWIVLD